MMAGRGDAALGSAQNIKAENLDDVQSLDLNQTCQQIWDAVTRRTDSVKELHPIAHSSDLISLQSKTLCQMSPGLHHGFIGAVCGAEHAAGALQTVKRKLGGAQTCRCRRDIKSNQHVS